ALEFAFLIGLAQGTLHSA
ncbi:hypothetical protein SEE8A_020468, partial [Salmonella enterica subsp. enterica serovar Enteritidis str. SE8a]